MHIKIIRGIKSISEFLDCSPNFVRNLIKNHGLPVVKAGSSYSLNVNAYLEWEKERVLKSKN